MPHRTLLTCFLVVALVATAGCESTASSARPSSGGAEPMADAGPYAKPGYVAEEVDGRLWVFPVGSEDYAEFKRVGEPAKHITRIGDGPRGMTIKGPDMETIIGYLAAKSGFYTEYSDGIVWVFEDGSEGLAEFKATGEPAKNATLIGVGPLGKSMRSTDKETIIGYLAAKPGFYTEYSDGIIWVFEDGSEGLAEFKASGEPAKNATLIGVGPLGKSVRSDDKAVIQQWLVAAPGYETHIDDGRLWVFEPGSEALAEYLRVGEPAKHVTRIGVGPMGMTVKAPDGKLIDSYLADN